MHSAVMHEYCLSRQYWSIGVTVSQGLRHTMSTVRNVESPHVHQRLDSDSRTSSNVMEKGWAGLWGFWSAEGFE